MVNKKLPQNLCRDNIRLGESLNDKLVFDSYLKNYFKKIKNSDKRYIAATRRLNQLISIQDVEDYSSLIITSHFHPQVNVNDNVHFNNANNFVIGNNIDENLNNAGVLGHLRNIDATIDNEDDDSSIALRTLLKSVPSLRRKNIKEFFLFQSYISGFHFETLVHMKKPMNGFSDIIVELVNLYKINDNENINKKSNITTIS
jgi:hypothetical protein